MRTCDFWFNWVSGKLASQFVRVFWDMGGILFYSIVCCFSCHLIFFFVSCLLRDFQFGHMDGNDYINSLIMGWVSRNASSPLSSHITLLFSPPHITCCQLLNQVWTDLYCQPPPLKMLLCGEVNYTDRLPSLFFSSVLGNFNHPLLSRKRTTRAPTNLLVRSIYEDCMDEGHAWIISIAVMCF